MEANSHTVAVAFVAAAAVVVLAGFGWWGAAFVLCAMATEFGA